MRLAPVVVAMLLSAGAAHAQSDLRWSAPQPGFALAPRLAAHEAINADLSRIDAQGDFLRRECLTDGGDNISWERDIDATMTGPRFLGLTVTTAYYCGGAHPGADTRSMTWDRLTDAPLDWTALWPAAQVQPIRPSPDFPPEAAVAMSPALVAWFRSTVRAAPEADPAWLSDCDAHYGDDPMDEGVVLWLDAEHNAIVVDLAWLAHAEQACASPQFLPLDEAERLGASPDLTRAVHDAHRLGAWRKAKDLHR